MDEVITIGVDLAKNVFQIHGVDAEGAVVVRRQIWATIFMIWFLTTDTSLAEWGTNVPINHHRFCEKQEIRVSRIADTLIAQILKINMDTSTTGYVHSNQTWEWKKQILSRAGRIDEMRYKH